MLIQKLYHNSRGLSRPANVTFSMDENESAPKRGNSLNEGEREIADMDEADLFFLLMESRIIQAS